MRNFLTTNRANDLFGYDFFKSPFEDLFNLDIFSNKSQMRTDIKKTPTGLEMTIDMAGFDKNDISLEYQDGYISVSAEKKQEEKGEYVFKERSEKISRRYFVGENLSKEDIKAKYENGVLKLDLKEKILEKKDRHIEIE